MLTLYTRFFKFLRMNIFTEFGGLLKYLKIGAINAIAARYLSVEYDFGRR